MYFYIRTVKTFVVGRGLAGIDWNDLFTSRKIAKKAEEVTQITSVYVLLFRNMRKSINTERMIVVYANFL